MVHAPEMHHVPLDADAASARAKIRKLIAENRAADEKPAVPAKVAKPRAAPRKPRAPKTPKTPRPPILAPALRRLHTAAAARWTKTRQKATFAARALTRELARSTLATGRLVGQAAAFLAHALGRAGSAAGRGILWVSRGMARGIARTTLALGSLVRRIARRIAAAAKRGAARLHTATANAARRVSALLARLPRAARLGARWTMGLIAWPVRAAGIFLLALATVVFRALAGSFRLTLRAIRRVSATTLRAYAAAGRALRSVLLQAAQGLAAAARAISLSLRAAGRALLAFLIGVLRLVAWFVNIPIRIAGAVKNLAVALARTLALAGRSLQACAQHISGAVVQAVHQVKVASGQVLRLAAGLAPSRQALARAGLAAYSALALVAVLALANYGLDRLPAPAPTGPETAEPVIAALPESPQPVRIDPTEMPVETSREIDWRHDVDEPSPDVAAASAPEQERLPAEVEIADAPTQPVVRIAVVIDDLGLNKKLTQRVVSLEGPLTLAFLPYANSLRTQTARARQRGHELLVHLPMEPKAAGMDPGPNAMRTGLSAREFERRLKWNLSRFSGFVGFNNHMGSRLTEDYDSMGRLLAEAKARGLLYFDSRTTAATVARPIAQTIDLPFAERDVFLDNVRSTAAIERRFDELEATARANGQAIAIGHPYRSTIVVLKRRIPQLAEKGIALVPLSALAESPVQRVAEASGSTSAFEGQ